MSEFSHLDELEAEAIYIIREVAASCHESILSGKAAVPVFTCQHHLEVQGNDCIS